MQLQRKKPRRHRPVDEQEANLRQTLGIPMNADLTVVDIPKHVGVPKVHGWTDQQIAGKSIEYFNDIISQRQKCLDQLQKTIDKERCEIDKLNDIRKRRIQLGD